MEKLEFLIGQRIRAMRKNRGWSQEELATRAQKSVFTLSQIERGVNLPNLKTLIDLATAFDCSIDDLVRVREGGGATAKTREHLQIEVRLHADIAAMDTKTLRAAQGAIKALFDAQGR